MQGEELGRRSELDDPTCLEDRDLVERPDDQSDHESGGDARDSGCGSMRV